SKPIRSASEHWRTLNIKVVKKISHMEQRGASSIYIKKIYKNKTRKQSTHNKTTQPYKTQ
ncbi:hypothetical protein LXA62_17790, partial [Erwinia amylovora]|uniref:hypothetical protein n=1 Tax=Erwinia amylovora TaxID=552 RepID=UPI0020C0E27A